MATYNKNNSGMNCRLEQQDLYEINKCKKNNNGLLDISASARYVCIYILDDKNKCAFIYGCNDNFCPDFKETIDQSEMHKAAHQKGFSGNKVVYEWFSDTDKTIFYQSTIIPLMDDNGKVTSILGLIKSLSKLSIPDQKGGDAVLMISENVGQSFVRLMINSREEEKRKISSSLHDEIGSVSVLINSLLSILREDIKDGKTNDALGNINKVQAAVQDSMSRIKKVIVDLRPPQLGDVGLNAAVKDLIDSIAPSLSLNFEYEYNVDDDVKMSETVKITLYRIVQEAINNTIKHAKAKNIEIVFNEDASLIFLTIKDDGIGYSKSKHRSINKLGILGMKENMAYLGGTIKIEGEKGKGTTISVKCPKISYARKL